jgi:O-antigen/teichoic acid export membrane protein
MKNKTKSIKNLIWLVLSQVITISFGLVIPRLFIADYGSEVNGLIQSLNQIIVYLMLFESGIGAVSMQALYGPIARGEWKDINAVLSATNRYYKKMGIWYFVTLVVLSLVYPFVVKSSLGYFTVMGCVFFSGIGNVIMFIVQGKYKVLLEADGKNYIIARLTTMLNVLTNIAKVALIALGWNIVLILISHFLVQILHAAVYHWYIKKNYKQLNLTVTPDFLAISQKNYMLVHQISNLIFQNTDVLILTVACGLKVVSVYSMFKLITTYLDQMLTTVTGSFSFILGQTFQTDRNKFISYIDAFDSIYGAIGFSMYSVCFFLMLPFIKLYTEGVTDANYNDGKLPVLFVTIALLTIMRTPMLYTINYAGHFKKTAPQTIVEATINVSLSLIGVYLFGIYGVLLGTIGALLYRTNDVIIYSNVKILKRSPKMTYLIHLVNIAVFGVCVFLYSLIFTRFDSYLWLVIAGAGCCAIGIPLFLLAQLACFKHTRAIFIPIVKKIFRR